MNGYETSQIHGRERTEVNGAAGQNPQAVMSEHKTLKNQLLESLTYQFTDMVTAIAGRCDLLADRLSDPQILAEISAIREHAMKAEDLNRTVFALAEEYRREVKVQTTPQA
jgi:hypothetical protein